MGSFLEKLSCLASTGSGLATPLLCWRRSAAAGWRRAESTGPAHWCSASRFLPRKTSLHFSHSIGAAGQASARCSLYLSTGMSCAGQNSHSMVRLGHSSARWMARFEVPMISVPHWSHLRGTFSQPRRWNSRLEMRSPPVPQCGHEVSRSGQLDLRCSRYSALRSPPAEQRGHVRMRNSHSSMWRGRSAAVKDWLQPADGQVTLRLVHRVSLWVSISLRVIDSPQSSQFVGANSHSVATWSSSSSWSNSRPQYPHVRGLWVHPDLRWVCICDRGSVVPQPLGHSSGMSLQSFFRWFLSAFLPSPGRTTKSQCGQGTPADGHETMWVSIAESGISCLQCGHGCGRWTHFFLWAESSASLRLREVQPGYGQATTRAGHFSMCPSISST
eukprot:comp20643_c0_seq1/m.42141 comp20643_c0_seq1/g.42141  ORF comp20643_c0_seq1/g.42141 comp20643_c0_seq1/m.42141 type:complete len:386 (+) comp20643_c0_seq1:311-1468(+)